MICATRPYANDEATSPTTSRSRDVAVPVKKLHRVGMDKLGPVEGLIEPLKGSVVFR